jgi:DNA invertase Pin-like site-specific DNA recombinase
MASLAEMERELTVERTKAGLEVARSLVRVGGRKRRMTDSKIESAKHLLASGYRLRMWQRILGCRCRRFTGGFLLLPSKLRSLSYLAL